MQVTKTKLEEKDYAVALDIWERSVLETHEFLKESDRLELKKEIPTYFKYVEAYLWYDDDEVIGFSGTNEQNLEMLFIDPKYINQGYGTNIVQYLIKENKVQFVDVNKDNDNAIKFYEKNGFIKYDESQKDEQGRDYPILHMKLA
ncbi:GNAT family N-acetyltransferase [Staphylococcus sp. NRL 16/872]|uniref:GNAT family N-acetyltransferase n=1 Tax=Staphylococcus sp. NRL 16/872 TaxID=2930131 RepID=UPI001FB436A6|nr:MULTISPECIES: GNAT family N-acetyltransferase [unclassified Staphylococcus]MCJ1656868.1 GNAT family N-acetyltransferase [Staphylococcus sp. NRL 21/187]MCJ1662616.1 GNAT family N-acetyltransferase [Staphylococcus sp. NRL 18/288]MCJ1668717.1 GNAT family N-acetyltransferase [Staphylococcus sp. NRL 19/737]WEN68933.1 GNAT family N-acetyltransferase [Staphylococcus sp. NRL 16/872]